MSDPEKELKVAEESAGLVSKGLAAGKVGTLSGAVLGISSVAPGYTLTASIGLIVAAVGPEDARHLDRGLHPDVPHRLCVSRAELPRPGLRSVIHLVHQGIRAYVGWMCGWGMVVATIIVLSNLAAIAVEFFYLFIARIVNSPDIADLAGNKLINIITTLVFIAVATLIASRGITTSEHVQYVLVGFQMTILLAFAVVAIVHVARGDAPAGLAFDLDWFNPFTGLALSAFVIGVTGSIFAFWGWDTCLTLGEESKDPTKVPGRAGLLCVLSILLTYLLVAVAVMMYAGVGVEGLGLGNEENADNVFGALADPVLGTWAGPLLFLAVLASSVASLQTTFLPAARAMLAMGAYGAFPERFAEVSPRFLVPTFATVVAGVVTGVFYTVVSLLSEQVLLDTIAALGIMICWYYGITAFACVWYFRSELFSSVHNVVFKFLFPLARRHHAGDRLRDLGAARA